MYYVHIKTKHEPNKSSDPDMNYHYMHYLLF